ncbi:DUF624 domain-containing protein [uncultured Microbacterium sp.]|uniref:DUF624 domain-containing protein n=1 Tax=uncultured Microbacterium sp. TaxID=191216 RepID=UPI0035CAE369
MNASTTPVKRRPWFAVSHETLESTFGLVYAALVVNLALVLANLPLAFFVFAVPNPLSYWPLFLALSLTLAPSITGAFGCFRALRDGAPAGPFVTFWRTYRRNFLRSFVIGTAAGSLLAFLLLDVDLVAQFSFGPLIVPTFVMLGLTAVAIVIMALAGFALYEHASWWAITKAAMYLAVKRWYFSAIALVLVGLIAAIVFVQPILGSFLAPSLLLFAVWSNAHFSFVKLIETAE